MLFNFSRWIMHISSPFRGWPGQAHCYSVKHIIIPAEAGIELHVFGSRLDPTFVRVRMEGARYAIYLQLCPHPAPLALLRPKMR
jgi:hypothetical protein